MKDVAGRRFSLSRLMADRLGNFGMMTALVLPVLFGAGSLALDVTNMMMTKSRLQGAADSAALAAASAIANDNYTPDQARELALNFMKAQMGNGDVASRTNVNITESTNADSSKSYKVVVNAAYTLDFNPVTRLFRGQSTDMNAASTAESAPGSADGSKSKNSISMYLVLDRSGSMSFKTNDVVARDGPKKCRNYTEDNWTNYPETVKETSPCYVKKIAALKAAVAGLVAQLDKADPEAKYVRMGAVSYNDAMQAAKDLAWGTSSASQYVQALPEVPTGGTDSSAAFKTGYQKISAAKESQEHKNKTGQEPTRYMVFMTDGQNTHLNGKTGKGAESDAETKKWCDEARKSGVEVYSVAFMAPLNGQKLLKYCATTEQHYFEAEEMGELISAFESIGKKVAAITARLTH